VSNNVFDSLRELGGREYDPTGFRRLARAGGLLVAVFVLGTFGYWTMAPEKYDLLDCAFMTTITLTTVGYGEVIPIDGDPALQSFTIGLIIVGMGIVLYFVSSLTAFIIEGELRDLIRMRKMDREIDKLENHLIICGIGQTGLYVLREVLQSNQPCVVIDKNHDHIQRDIDELDTDFLYIVGDATQDSVLQQAGIERATALVASLGTDRDNLFVTITARSLNDELRIVARGEHPEAEQKFKMAGATSVIYTNVLGGLRMAAEAIRPEVTTFLDLMMQDHDHYRRVEELPVPDDSPLIGTTVRETKIRQHTDALVIAVYRRESEDYVFNPGPEYELTTGCKLIVLTLVDDIETLEALIRGDLW
jgi:voltage-gated potassium channel